MGAIAATLTGTAALAVLVLGSSGGNSNMVPLSELVSEQGAYEGREVRTTGFVRRFADPDGSTYYLLEDRRGDRVILAPARRVGRLRCKRMEVRGRFRLSPGVGRVIYLGRALCPPQRSSSG